MPQAFLQLVGRQQARDLGGLSLGAAAYAAAQIVVAQDTPGPTVVGVATARDAQALSEAIVFHMVQLGSTIPVYVLPPDDARPLAGASSHPRVSRQRLCVAHAVASGHNAVVVACARSLMLGVMGPSDLQGLHSTISVGDVLDRDKLVEKLVEWGYLTTSVVDDVGCLSWRGDTVEVWTPGQTAPVRIVFFDNEVEDIRVLAHDSRTHPIKTIDIFAARETVVTKASLVRAADRTAEAVEQLGSGHTTRRRVLTELKEGLWFPGAEDYLGVLYPLGSILDGASTAIMVEPDQINIELGAFEEQILAGWAAVDPQVGPLVLPWDRFVTSKTVMEGFSGALCMRAMAGEGPNYDARPNTSLRVGKADLEPVTQQLAHWREDGWQIALICDSHTRSERVCALLAPHGIAPEPLEPDECLTPGKIHLVVASLSEGFQCEPAKIAFVTAEELFGERARAPAARRTIRDAALASFTELKVDDLVVHTQHGIGQFLGLKRLEINGVSQDYTEVAYRGGDRMYLPVTRLDQIYRYRAVGDVKPRLDKLGGETWAKRKQKISDKVLAMASELLEIHARRATVKGHKYVGRPPAYQQFKETFPYVETSDQDNAIEDVLADLESDQPMDRLIVGDVGFGKTEVAMRAAMRVVLDGHQVAVLAPTTVLAFQHHSTFQARFEGSGVRIGLLSRFVSAAQTRQVQKDVQAGEINILIGTSALLGRQVRFSHLGLVILDEEHRFGVRQKEQLKKLGDGSVSVEYLAMSATPIPRTLHMALTGLRNISLIATPPQGRHAVRTSVVRRTDERVRQDIQTELRRGGQVFYVHNRVAGIERHAAHIRSLVPEATVVVAHGQLDEKRLEQILVDFVQRRSNVLVTTSIIESGIDLPNVNTMIIDRADRFGLSQLYQLRGRVGRGFQRGVCVLMVGEDGNLNRDAMRRLRVLQEHTQLGSGFAIASADLEMRGSGNLLGKAQHGQIQAVGLDTYVELLESAASVARGEQSRMKLDPEIEVPVSTVLPDDYVVDLDDRLTQYRRIAMVSSAREARDLVGEWETRYGPPPPEVLNLGWLAEAKLRCRELGVDRVTWMKIRVALRFHPSTIVAAEDLAAMVQSHPNRFSLQDQNGVTVLLGRFTTEEAKWPFRFLHWMFQLISKCD